MHVQIACCAFAAISFAATIAEAQTTITIDPSATFLRTSGDSAPGTTPIELSSLGISPGQLLRLTTLGDFDNGPSGDVNFGMLGVFSSSATLLPDTVIRRVADAIPAGVPIVSPLTNRGRQPTDFPEDFNISVDQARTPATVEVPTGATHLFVCAWDSLYFDNSDPDGDFGVLVEFIGPGTWTDLGNGLAGSTGTPSLTGTGTLVGGSSFTLDVGNARTTSPSILLIGLSEINLPFFGGVLVPSPDLSLPSTTTALGTDSLTFDFFLRLPQGSELTFQYWVVDAQAPNGLAATNALRATTP